MVERATAPRDLVVIGASAGGVEALQRVVRGLPPDLAASVCVVLHIAPESPSALAHILRRAGRLQCRTAADGDALTPGLVLVAPPDRHLTIEDGHVRLSVGPRENGHRPAVDVLFRSAAEARSSRVIGVILSGSRDDGAAGLAVIKRGGGAVVVQDPGDALYAGMPTNALASVTADVVAPVDEIAGAIAALVSGDDGDPSSPSKMLSRAPVPTTTPSGDSPGRDAVENLVTTCPECGGVLSEDSVAGVAQWHCRVGHRYSTDSLVDAQAEGIEAGLWAAVRALEDRCLLLTRLADRFERQRQARSAESFRRRAREATEQAALVRDVLERAAQSSLRSLEPDERAA